MMKHIKRFLFLFLVILVIITLIDLLRIFSYKTHLSIPENEIITNQDEVYAQLVSGNDFIAWEKLDGALQFIGDEYDVSDFKLVNLIRILYEYEEIIPPCTRQKIDSVLLGFHYWMDEPCENSVCYWSENHQILFSSAEYLIGQLYADRIFQNSKLTGLQHQLKAKKRILYWLEMRWLYGFTEFYSGTYYIEDVAALLNLIDHADDEEIVQKSKIILDLLFYDISTQSFQGMMGSISGRAYERNRKGGINENLGEILPFLLENKNTPVGMVYALSRTKNYTIPPVFKEIAQDTSTFIIKQSNGLDINELKTENLYGTDTKSIMMQWGMEAFTNTEIVCNSMQYIRKNRMFSNKFLREFRYLDFTVLNVFSLQKLFSKMFNPATNGKAIQRGNTYTYKTNKYSLYSVQNYHPGEYADQHHVAGMNVGNHFSIFHSHPARKADDYTHSPNYWVGYGRLPHVAQDKNVNISIYHIPDKKNVTEKYLLDYTHAYFPTEKFDSVVVSGRYVFGRKNDVFCALIGSGELKFVSSDNIVQHGRKAVWILEAALKEDEGTFENFIARITNNSFGFDDNTLKVMYQSAGTIYELQFNNMFKIDKKVIDTNYPRFLSPYVQAERKPAKINISHNGQKLLLDFYNLERVIK